MVYQKNKSGDPDYDDKQPIEQHAGKIVKSADGRDVLLSDVVGPVDPYTGEHVSLDGPTAEDLDNRPAPGEVATKPSEVQTYSADDTPSAARTDDADVTQPEPARADDSAVKPVRRTTK